jgi:hypothetical protein
MFSCPAQQRRFRHKEMYNWQTGSLLLDSHSDVAEDLLDNIGVWHPVVFSNINKNTFPLSQHNFIGK